MTFQRGIRGAITVEENSVLAIKDATVELLQSVSEANLINVEDISHVIFTLTRDLTTAFPAKFARDILNWDNVPMMCFNELNIENSLKMCLRVLVVVNTEKKQNEIKHVYLKGAKVLRPDFG